MSLNRPAIAFLYFNSHLRPPPQSNHLTRERIWRKLSSTGAQVGFSMAQIESAEIRAQQSHQMESCKQSQADKKLSVANFELEKADLWRAEEEEKDGRSNPLIEEPNGADHIDAQP